MRRSLPQLRLEDTEGHQQVLQEQDQTGRLEDTEGYKLVVQEFIII